MLMPMSLQARVKASGSGTQNPVVGRRSDVVVGSGVFVGEVDVGVQEPYFAPKVSV